jgi:hypothetical protein
MRKALKTKQSKPLAKAGRWSARRAKALMGYRSAGKASNCGK